MTPVQPVRLRATASGIVCAEAWVPLLDGLNESRAVVQVLLQSEGFLCVRGVGYSMHAFTLFLGSRAYAVPVHIQYSHLYVRNNVGMFLFAFFIKRNRGPFSTASLFKQCAINVKTMQAQHGYVESQGPCLETPRLGNNQHEHLTELYCNYNCPFCSALDAVCAQCILNSPCILWPRYACLEKLGARIKGVSLSGKEYRARMQATRIVRHSRRSYSRPF